MNNPFSIRDAINTITKDAPHLDGERLSNFIKSNQKQLYYAANSWYYVMQDVGVPVGLSLAVLRCVSTAGLKSVMSSCRALADGFLGSLAEVQLPDEHRWEIFLTQANSQDKLLGAVLDFLASHAAQGEEDLGRRVLQFLLYLERFTYIGADTSVRASVDKFLRVNARCRDLCYNWEFRPGLAIMSLVRDALSEILTYQHWDFSIDWCGFSSGSITEAMFAKNKAGKANKSPAGKWYWLSQYYPNYLGLPQYPFPGGRNAFRTYRQPVMTLVPKTLDVRRAICPEDVCMSYFAHGVLHALRGVLDANGSSRFINEEDQSVNRAWARSGSSSGEWSTIDMSSASDSIARDLAFCCIPEWFKPILLDCMSWEFQYRNDSGSVSVRKLFTLLTSGNPLTWLFESVWFLALGRVAASLCGIKAPELAVFVFGDDMIVRSDIYQTTIELLERFGHSVNQRKSYCTGAFRESCGGWYYNGTDVTPTYWPRRELHDDSIEIEQSLISLQHRTLAAGMFTTSRYLTEEVIALDPKVTKSALGSSFDDLWDPELDSYYDALSRHTTFVAKKGRVPDSWVPLLQHVAYYEYLQRGPAYDSELDKLLGVSSSRFSRLLEFDSGSFMRRMR